MSAAPTGAGGSVGGGGGSILLLLAAGGSGGQEMQMVAGGNGLSSASKYGLGGSADGWARSRIVLQTIYRQQSVFTITKKAPTMAFSWLKAPTSAFTFKTLC